MASRIISSLAQSLLPLRRRRQLLQAGSPTAGIALGLTECATCAATVSSAQGSTLLAYAGSRTTRKRNARGEGISVFKVNSRTLDACIRNCGAMAMMRQVHCGGEKPFIDYAGLTHRLDR